MKIAHVRCGSDIRDGLQQAGIDGDFIEYSDPVCQGPVPGDIDEAELLNRRAAFLSDACGAGTPAQCRERLSREREAIGRLADYDKVLLWFEHDIYDQSVLIRLFDILADRHDLDGRLFLVAIDRFAGIERFIGLGQLSPAQLATLPARAKPVTTEQLTLGRSAWQAFREPDPQRLWSLIDNGSAALPLLAGALRRHLMDLPWIADGLSLTERLSLQAIADGAATPGAVFRGLHQKLEPQPFLGDLMFWPILRRLATADEPAVTSFDSWQSPVSLTAFGEALLMEQADWCQANGIDRWMGGLHLLGHQPSWRWDAGVAQPVAGA